MHFRGLATLLLATLLCVCVSCSDEPASSPSPTPGASPSANVHPPETPGPAVQHKVCLAISSDGLGDRGYNDMQYSALVAARARYAFEMDVQSMQDTQEDPAGTAIGQLLTRNCTVVVAGQGWSMSEAVDQLAPAYPGVLFVLVDAVPATYHPNVAGTRFHVEEAAFQAGYLAASLTRTNALASIGGMAVPAVLDFIQGFEAGAIHKNPHCMVHRVFLAETHPKANPWNSPTKAQEIGQFLARTHHVDILFAVAGGSNPGVFRAAKDCGVYAIGVDTDQDYMAQGVILTSVVKHFDVALMSILDAIMTNSFTNSRYEFNLSNHGVSLSPMTFTRQSIPKSLLQELDALRDRIVDGSIQVPATP